MTHEEKQQISNLTNKIANAIEDSIPKIREIFRSANTQAYRAFGFNLFDKLESEIVDKVTSLLEDIRHNS